MSKELKNQVSQVAMTRAAIDLPMSFLLNIKSNLASLLKEDLQGDPLIIESMRAAWKAEIESLEMEIILRN